MASIWTTAAKQLWSTSDMGVRCMFVQQLGLSLCFWRRPCWWRKIVGKDHLKWIHLGMKRSEKALSWGKIMKTSFILSDIRKNFGLLLQPVSWMNTESKLTDNWTMILLIEPCCSCSVTKPRPTCNPTNCSTPSSPEPYAGTSEAYFSFCVCLS